MYVPTNTASPQLALIPRRWRGMGTHPRRRRSGGISGLLLSADISNLSTRGGLGAASSAAVKSGVAASAVGVNPSLSSGGATSASTPTSASALSSIVATACQSFNKTSNCQGGRGANKNSGLLAFFQAAVQSRFLPDPSTPTATAIFDAEFSCATGQVSTAGSSSASAQQALGVAGKVGSAGVTIGGAIATAAGAANVVPVIGQIVSAVLGIASLITGIFAAHHAKAVQAEAEAICSAVPQVNSVLQQIDAGLAAGSITPAQAQGQYSSLQSSFTKALQSGGTTYKQGDTLWAYNAALVAVIQARNDDLQNGVLTSGAPGPWTSAGQGVSGAVGQLASSLGISSETLWLIAAGAAVLFLL